MTQLIGFAGKKQSGKDTCCNFVLMLKLIENGVCQKARLNDKGVIEVSDVFGESNDKEWMEFRQPDVNVAAVMNNFNDVKIYSLAGELKRICVDVFGIKHSQVYGTDEQKNQLQEHLLWENMPGVMTPHEWSMRQGGVAAGYTQNPEDFNIKLGEGPMTAREFMQFLGTDVMRKMYKDIWVNSLMKKIEEDNPKIALISDVRFDNEIKKIKDELGIVIGLKRDIYKSKDKHSSEKIKFSLCSKVIDNTKMDLPEQNKAIYGALTSLNCKYLTDLGV